MKDFINEDIEEEGDNEEDDAEDGEGENKRKHESDEEDDQVDDEDYDLIEENLGIKVKRVCIMGLIVWKANFNALMSS